MAPFYRWGSTASRLVPLRGGNLLFTTNFREIRRTILSTSEGWKAEPSLEPPSGFEHGRPLNWESSTLTTRPQNISFAFEWKSTLKKVGKKLWKQILWRKSEKFKATINFSVYIFLTMKKQFKNKIKFHKVHNDIIKLK